MTRYDRWQMLLIIRKNKMLGLLLVLLSALVLIAYWVGDQREPATLNYCVRYGEPNPKIKPCVESKTLKIPAIYYGYIANVTRNDPKDYQRIEVAYPSMKAWDSLSWLDKRNTPKIEIQIQGSTSQTVHDVFEVDFLGTPKPIHIPQFLFGLDRYDYDGAGGMYLLPLGEAPSVHLYCSLKGLTQDPSIGTCTATTYTSWQLKLVYYYPQALLPHWADVQSRINELIESFAVAH